MASGKELAELQLGKKLFAELARRIVAAALAASRKITRPLAADVTKLILFGS
jgi:hypothetical protein